MVVGRGASLCILSPVSSLLLFARVSQISSRDSPLVERLERSGYRLPVTGEMQYPNRRASLQLLLR